MKSARSRCTTRYERSRGRKAAVGLLIILAAVLLAGCSAGGAPTPVAVSEPGPSATEPPVAASDPEPTALPAPTSTAEPTEPPEATAPPVATPTAVQPADGALVPGSGDDSGLVQAAVDAAEGATVMLGPGVFEFDRHVTIDGDVTIVGSGTGTTVLQRANDGAVFIADGSNLSLRAMTVTSTFVTDAEERDPLVEVQNSSLEMEDVLIERAPGTGLWIFASTATVTDSAFSDNGWIGLWSLGNTELTITSTAANGNEDGFVFDEFTVVDISQSQANGNSGAGYWWDGSASGDAQQNDAIDNGFGFLTSGNSSPTLVSNFAEGNSEVGFGFRESATAIARSNEAAGNTQGFYVDGEATPTLVDNVAVKNTDGGFAWFDEAGGSLVGAVTSGNGNDLYVEETASPEILDNSDEPEAVEPTPAPTASPADDGARCPSDFVVANGQCERFVGSPQLSCNEGQLIAGACAIDVAATPQESCDAPYLLYQAEAGDPTLPGLQGTCAWFDSAGTCPAGDVYNIDAGGGERFTHPCKHPSQVTYACDAGALVGDVCRRTVAPFTVCSSGTLVGDACVEYADPL